MDLRSKVRGLVLPLVSERPELRHALGSLEARLDVARHFAGRFVPQLIRADPRSIYLTLTANCNLRCIGCNYGREFMAGSSLPWPLVRDLLDDVKEAGFDSVRLYGGEPLLHKDLPAMVARCVELGLRPWLTTNAILLREKIDALYDAGLREVTIGSYGNGEDYDAYVQRKDRYARMEAGVAYTRERYGDAVDIKLAWLLMRPTCSLDSVKKLWEFAERYATPISVNLIHYSLPYFNEGPDRMLQFRPEDRPAIEAVIAELLSLKEQRPEMIVQTPMALRSIPDWLIRGPDMKVPCDRYRLIWVGADGTVQLCYVTFKLGNLHEKRLRDMLFTAEHHQAARDAFALRCPNCHCSYDRRVRMHGPSRRLYS
jgi:cyclic pyranopterin phosphate synthase